MENLKLKGNYWRMLIKTPPYERHREGISMGWNEYYRYER